MPLWYFVVQRNVFHVDASPFEFRPFGRTIITSVSNSADYPLLVPDLFEAFLDGTIKTPMEDHHLPGVTVSVVQNGHLIFAKGHGLARTDPPQPVVADQTLFRIGSISKAFTFSAVMQLVEKGRLDLNADGIQGNAHGFWTGQIRGYRTVVHGGAVSGFLSDMVLVPELGLGFFSSTNDDAGRGSAGALSRRIIENFYPSKSSPPSPDPAFAILMKGASVPEPEILVRYPTPLAWTVHFSALAAAILAVLGSFGLVPVWRVGSWSIGRRLRHTVVILAGLALVWALHDWNVLGFRYLGG